MMNSTKLAQAAAVILVTTSAISFSGCAASGSTSRHALNNAETIDYCVKRGTQMECHRQSTTSYAAEIEMENERLEMRDEIYE